MLCPPPTAGPAGPSALTPASSPAAPLLPSSEPLDFSPPCLPPRLGLVTRFRWPPFRLDSAFVRPGFVRGFFLASEPRPPLAPRPRPRQPPATPASPKPSSCLTSLRTSSEEAPLDNSVSPRGSFRPPGSPRGDALPLLASLSCGIVFADGPYPPPASERPLLSPRLVRSTGRSSAGAGHVLALRDACCPHSPIRASQ